MTRVLSGLDWSWKFWLLAPWRLSERPRLIFFAATARPAVPEADFQSYNPIRWPSSELSFGTGQRARSIRSSVPIY